MSGDKQTTFHVFSCLKFLFFGSKSIFNWCNANLLDPPHTVGPYAVIYNQATFSFPVPCHWIEMSYLGQIYFMHFFLLFQEVAVHSVLSSKLTKCRQLQLAESFSSMIEWRLPWTLLLDNNIFSKKWGETSCRLLFQTENRSSRKLENLLTFFACLGSTWNLRFFCFHPC